MKNVSNAYYCGYQKQADLYRSQTGRVRQASSDSTFEGEGADAAIEMLKAAAPEILARVTFLYAGNLGAGATLKARGAGSCDVFSSVPTAVGATEGLPDQRQDEHQVYIAGTEGFIAQALQLAIDHGIDYRVRARPSIADRSPAAYNACIARASRKTSPPASCPASIAAFTSSCAIISRVAWAPSKACRQMPRRRTSIPTGEEIFK